MSGSAGARLAVQTAYRWLCGLCRRLVRTRRGNIVHERGQALAVLAYREQTAGDPEAERHLEQSRRLLRWSDGLNPWRTARGSEIVWDEPFAKRSKKRQASQASKPNRKVT